MTPEQIGEIMPQLDEALRFSRDASKTIYVFRDDQVGMWCLSGRLPKEADNGFYVAYPNGETDQLGPVPPIGPADWNFYWAHHDTHTPAQRAAERISAVSTEQTRRILLSYCAFAPFIQFVACMAVMGSMPSFWEWAVTLTSITFPMTVVFSLKTWNGQNQKATALSCSLITNAHVAFLWVVSAISAFEIRAMPVPQEVFPAAILACMALSGVALLLSFDARPK